MVSSVQKGFTLIELAIVLIAMGLLAGGILYGKSIVQQSHIRNAIKTVDEYRTAIDSFKQQYLNLPGDITNATAFWGGSTANGNGDGKITYATSAGNNESLRAWQQLGLSNLIAGNYSGTANAQQTAIPGVNEPNAVISSGFNTGYAFDYISVSSITGSYNYLILGGSAGTGISDGIALTPLDAQQIDTKLDDGLPTSGTVIGKGGRIGGTTSSYCVPANTNAYNIQASYANTLQCVLEFQL